MDVIDFDAWYEENVDATIPFRLLSRDWELPGDIPAIALLRFQRIERLIASLNDDDFVPPEDLSLEDVSYESLARMMIGDQLLDEWLRLGIRGKLLEEVTRRLFAIYQGRGGDGEGKAQEQETETTPEDSPATS